ncbi:uncharacterized protein LOC113300338 [Papaver somniferum]|uniref:uncharacterized protein LOC113300338 n=1 Tax=Papaver somniferum TaxID=3469 RepID=UPI000E6F648E|nr:uncharacterized protein LOC113300338 [Papaver somniferum]
MLSFDTYWGFLRHLKLRKNRSQHHCNSKSGYFSNPKLLPIHRFCTPTKYTPMCHGWQPLMGNGGSGRGFGGPVRGGHIARVCFWGIKPVDGKHFRNQCYSLLMSVKACSRGIKPLMGNGGSERGFGGPVRGGHIAGVCFWGIKPVDGKHFRNQCYSLLMSVKACSSYCNEEHIIVSF